MIRSYKTEGIIIKRRNFGELDRILTVLTRRDGKIQVKAPGVRKLTSRRSSHIELLNLSMLTLYKSSRVLFPIVTEAQTFEDFSAIKNTLYKIGFAYYVFELIDSLCAENQENRRAFFLVRDTLFKLNNYSSNSNEIMQQWNNEVIGDFEDKLLVSLGFLPEAHNIKDRQAFIENILERKLRTKRLLPLFLNEF